MTDHTVLAVLLIYGFFSLVISIVNLQKLRIIEEYIERLKD